LTNIQTATPEAIHEAGIPYDVARRIIETLSPTEDEKE
jgi:excinuclease ABC subunit C